MLNKPLCGVCDVVSSDESNAEIPSCAAGFLNRWFPPNRDPSKQTTVGHSDPVALSVSGRVGSPTGPLERVSGDEIEPSSLGRY